MPERCRALGFPLMCTRTEMNCSLTSAVTSTVRFGTRGVDVSPPLDFAYRGRGQVYPRLK